MIGNIPVLALAAISAVQASPLGKRQATSVISAAVSTATGAAPSAITSAIAGASTAAESVTSAASSAVESATSAASSAASSATESASSAAAEGSSALSSEASSASSIASSEAGAASTAVSSAAVPSTTGVTGNESFALYPCPTGFLLTYVEANRTIQAPVNEVTAAFGNWANSSYFPNTTANEGEGVGATHTVNLQGTELIEELVNMTMTEESGAARYTWNLTNGPVEAMGVSISNYSTVLSIYDPGFDSTNEIGSNTTVLQYTNFCANEQAAGMELVMALTNLELDGFVAQVPAAETPAPEPSAPAEGASTMASEMSSSAAEATSSAAEGASSAEMTATSGAASATSAAASGAGSATSAAASGVGAATSGAASGVGAATSGVASVASTPGSVAQQATSAVASALTPSSAA